MGKKKMKTLKITRVKYTHTHILPMGRAIRVYPYCRVMMILF